MGDQLDGRELKGRTAQLEARQWEWLDERASREKSRSASHELRKMVDREMERELVGAAALSGEPMAA